MPRTAAGSRTAAGARTAVPQQQNMFVYSEALNNAAYTTSNLTVGNTPVLGPDDQMNAWPIIESVDGSDQIHAISQYLQSPASIVPGSIVTLSFSVAPVVRGYLAMFADNGGGASCFLNLSTGLITSSSNILAFYSRPEKYGFIRYEITFRKLNYAQLAKENFYLCTAAGAGYTGNGSTACYMTKMQYTQGYGAGPYVPTTSSPVNTGAMRSAVANEQNLFAQSNNFTSATTPGWATNLTTPTTAITDPFGGNNAWKFTDSLDGANAQHYISHTFQNGWFPMAGRVHTASVYVLPGQTWCAFRYNSLASTTFFDLTNNTASGGTYVNAGVEVLPNGWKRVWVAYLLTAQFEAIRFYQCTFASLQYQGDGTGVLYVYNLQLNEGSTPSPVKVTGATPFNRGPIRSKVT